MGSNTLAKQKFQASPDLDIDVIGRDGIDVENDFVIYAECIRGNPLGIRNVIRWILYPPPAGIIETWDLTSDIVLFYSFPYFHNFYLLSDCPFYLPDMIDYITSMEFNRDYMMFTIIDDRILKKCTGSTRRQGVLYSRRKCGGIYGTPMYDTECLGEASLIPDHMLIEKQLMTEDYILSSFSSCERFINYDLYSFLGTIAHACGTDSVTIPNRELHKDDWRKNAGWMDPLRYGLDDNNTDHPIINTDYDAINRRSIQNLDFVISKRLNLDRVRFTEPMLELSDMNGVPTNNITLDISIPVYSLEIVFYTLPSFSGDGIVYENLFDANYGSLNKGPRLELSSDGKLGLIVGSDQPSEFDGFELSSTISANTLYKIILVFDHDSIIINFNDYQTHHLSTRFPTNRLGLLRIGGGFDATRDLKHARIRNLQLFNYRVESEMNKIKGFDRDYDHCGCSVPVCTFQSFIRPSLLNIGYTERSIPEFTVEFACKSCTPYDKMVIGNLHFELTDQEMRISQSDNSIVIYNTPIEPTKQYRILLTADRSRFIIRINDEVARGDFGIRWRTGQLVASQSFWDISVKEFHLLAKFDFDRLDSQQIRNTFYTFGFIKMDGLFTNEVRVLDKAFNYLINHHSTQRFDDYIPGSCEYIYEMSEMIVNAKLNRLLQIIFGESYYYNGSDAKLYNSDTNWHCDRRIENIHLKIALYLNNSDKDTGCLRVLPGSHIRSDTFSRILAKTAIPLFLGPGGFREDVFIHDNKEIPSFPVENRTGDITIFHLGLYHAAFGNHINKKMFAINFAASYEDPNDPEKLECIDSDCFIIAHNRIGVDPYSPERITSLYPRFEKYIRAYGDYYELYFKELLENDNSIDRFVRLLLTDKESPEIKRFLENNINSNTKKDSEPIHAHRLFSI